MKLKGLDIEIIRGETASVSFTINDSNGAPLRLLNSDMFDNLDILFKVKRNSQTIKSEYVIHKALNINNIKHFASEEILNVKEEIAKYGGIYDPYTWSGCIFEDEDGSIKDQLYYHPDLDEYGYYWETMWEETNGWVPYSLDITIPFESGDTANLSYGDYYYDLVLEASNDSGPEYENILVNQHRFSVTYRV